MPKTYTCKNCRRTVEKIGIVSRCCQTFHLDYDDYTDLEVMDTFYAFCLDCGTRIPATDLLKFTGLREHEDETLNKILTRKEALPLLMGLDDELDTLIGRALKGDT
jgi:hypothetical protein